MKKIKVLITGATGHMGREGLKQLHKNKSMYEIIIFSLPTPSDKKILKSYRKDKSIKIIWGDLTNYNDVKNAVEHADIVLHLGALVAPVADHKPKLAWKVNFEGTKNIVDAIKSRQDSDKVKLIYIGTVAQTGNRVPPYHWGRVGDPMVPCPFDYYALSKIAAERYVIESGLKHWVSLRQTAMLHENILDVNDGISYHQPLNNHFEWSTAGDSGRIMHNICSPEIPEKFWRNVYNIGGGKLYRLTSFQFYEKFYDIMGVDFRDFESPNWYAIRNFHGQYYYDSDKLEEHLHFRSETIDDVLLRIKRKLPLKMRILKYLPKRIIRTIMHKLAIKGNTPLRWIRENNENKINAFFGSIDKWKSITDWDKFRQLSNLPHKKLDHGYDETIPDSNLTINDFQKAAQYRGGKCLSISLHKNDIFSKLRWSCAHNHIFEASPYLVLKTGHWCPECIKAPWNFDEQAKVNSFIAQVWYADHDENENKRYA